MYIYIYIYIYISCDPNWVDAQPWGVRRCRGPGPGLDARLGAGGRQIKQACKSYK